MMRKLILLLSFIFFYWIGASAQSTDSLITIQKGKITVVEILKAISEQSGLDFSYNAKKIDGRQEVFFFAEQLSLEECLDQLAAQISVSYSIIDDQIVLNFRKKKQGKNKPTDLEKYHTLSGFISDRLSGENLIGATVSLVGSGLGTATNAFGFYSLRLPKGACELSVSYVGFDTEELNFSLEKDQRRDLLLAPASLDLPDVIVRRSLREIISSQLPGQMELTPADLEKIPEFAGETGLVKSLQTLPGVKMHSDGSAFFFTRGGERDQNLIIIDDAPIYNPAHLFGFYSIVVPDFTKSIKVYKSDIPANLGDRLSSIIDIRTKDGNLNKWELNAAVNPLIARFSIEGPIVKKRGAVFFAMRRSNFGWLDKRKLPQGKFEFGDISFKWNHKLNDKNRLFLTILSNADIFSNEGTIDSSGVQWGNFAATLRWNHLFGARWFSNTILSVGSYNYQLSGEGNSWQSGIGTMNFKTDFTYFAQPQWTLKFGLEAHGHFFNPGTFSTESLGFLFPTLKQDYSRQRVLYLQSDYTFFKKWQFNAGLRMISWENQGPAKYFTFDANHDLLDSVSVGAGTYQTYTNVDPRLSLKYHIDSTSQLKLSYGIYHQYIQLISNSVSPFSSLEVWLPSSPNIKPQRAAQAAIGYLKYFPKTNLEFSTSAYYKYLDNLIDYKSHARTVLNPLLEGELRFGNMRAYGLEFLLKKKIGRLNGWMTYTYSRAIRQTAEVNNGKAYPAFQDRPHDFSILLNYQAQRRIFCSAYWTVYSGSTFSSPTGFYTYKNNRVPIYDEKNNDRLPAYQRLDVAVKFILNKKEENRFKHSLTFSIYNVLAHKNIVAINFNKIIDENNNSIVPGNILDPPEFVTIQADLVRFFPSLTYKFKL